MQIRVRQLTQDRLVLTAMHREGKKVVPLSVMALVADPTREEMLEALGKVLTKVNERQAKNQIDAS